MPSNSIPADITADITDRCNLKCKLELGYDGDIKINTRLTDHFNRLTNSGEGAEMNNGLVIYNGDEKKLTNISIIKKSLHKYNGFSADAELLMYHDSLVDDYDPLIISIPITENNSGGIIDDIIVESDPDGTSPFNFNPYDIVPVNKPFYAYKAILPDDIFESVTQADIVVFNKMYSLSVTTANYEKLTQHSMSTQFEVSPGEQITYNEYGASKTSESDFPLIECQPYEDEDPNVSGNGKWVWESETGTFGLDMGDYKEWAGLAVVQIIIGIFLITFLFYLFNFIFKSTKKIEIDGIDSPTG